MLTGKIKACVKLQRGTQIFPRLLGIAHEFFAQAQIGQIHGSLYPRAAKP